MCRFGNVLFKPKRFKQIKELHRIDIIWNVHVDIEIPKDKQAFLWLVCYTAVFSVVTQCSSTLTKRQLSTIVWCSIQWSSFNFNKIGGVTR